MQVPGIMALVSLPVCLIFGEFQALYGFVLTALVSVGVGQLCYRPNRQIDGADLRESMAIVAVAWLVIFAIGAIPYLAIAPFFDTASEFRDVWNALFESVSGFTTTGLTMSADASQLPHCLQWWRSFTQWIGGVGLIALTLSFLAPSRNVQQLYEAEARTERIAPTLRETVQRIWLIYLLYTAVSILLFLVAGMPWWEAVNHGLTGMATGGFTITPRSFQDYSNSIQLAAVLVMITAAMSFLVHARFLKERNFSALWQDTRHRGLWILLGIGTFGLLIENYWDLGTWLGIESLFQWAAALTTCGFSIVDEQSWSPAARLLLSLGMIFGGVSGSTAGGLKIDRIVVLYKSVTWHLRLIFIESPDDLRYELNDQVLSEKEAHRQLKAATVLATFWFMSLAIGVFFLLHIVGDTYTLPDVVLEVSSALGTSGLSTGIANPNLFWAGKLILMLLMWMGRLEIISVLIFVGLFVTTVKNRLSQS
jgi:trk system potassium uptake protein TrkH